MRLLFWLPAGVALALLGCEEPPGAVVFAPPDAPQSLDGGGGAADLAPPQGVGSFRFDVTDDETGLALPSRVVITAVPPTAPPRFDVNARGEVVNGEVGVGIAPGLIGAPEGVLLIAGGGSLPVPAGTYDLFISHGPEWEADIRRVTVAAHSTVAVEAALRHSVDTRGWLAADLHVHSGRSFDSHLQLDTRVVTEVTVGVELIVATDHNVLSDLQPDLEQLGYASLARAIVGDEFNFYEGHGGAYPMPYAPKDEYGGAVLWKLDWDTVRLVHSADMFAYLHNFPTRPVVTVNHPRLLPDLGYFTNLRWAPPAPMPDAGKFDAIELLNGYMHAPLDAALLMRDWFFLLSGGTRVTALGSSDTHRLRDVKAGFPRTWLRMPSDDPTRVFDSELADAIRHQRAIASNGPFALLTVEGAQIGDLVTATGPQVTIDALVDAPGWIDVDKVRIFVNGKVADERAVAPGLRPVFHDRFPLSLPPGDSWVVLQASGRKPLPVALIGEHQGGAVMPFVITNPVFVDRDGDKTWRPVLADPRDADPGPIAPLRAPHEGELDGFPPSHPAPEDCEPPLWVEPWNWVNP